jgi:hypothetical protein
VFSKINLGLLAMVAVYLFGGVSQRHNVFPWPQVSSLRAELLGPKPRLDSRYTFADDGRLTSDETKIATTCPKQSERTAVLLVIGQSNAANHGGQRYRSEHGAHVVNFFDGQCFVAASPLLGSTDARGEYWTQLGNLLITSGKFDDVVIVPLAFSGSEVMRWAQGGDINRLLVNTAKQLELAPYQVTDVLWVQGEIDYVKGTSEDVYRKRFLSMVHTLRAEKIEAPVYVSITSKCLEPTNGGFKVDAQDKSIVRTQLAMPAIGNGIRRGINTDSLLDEVDRYDDCHMGGSGERKVAEAWADLLLADQLSNSSGKLAKQL